MQKYANLVDFEIFNPSVPKDWGGGSGNGKVIAGGDIFGLK